IYNVLLLSSSTAFVLFSFFFNDPATTEIYTLSLHDALPILVVHGRDAPRGPRAVARDAPAAPRGDRARGRLHEGPRDDARRLRRSEEHTSELQSLAYLVCRLLLEKKKNHLHK